jgi:hypothetical protein
VLIVQDVYLGVFGVRKELANNWPCLDVKPGLAATIQ